MSGTEALAARLDELLDTERAAIDDRMAALSDGLLDGAPAWLADAIRYALATGGKRLRPVLCVAAHRAVGGVTSDAILDAGISIELIHTYSLIHDDLPCMDDDDLRRGRPTTHRVHGTRTATVAGASLIPMAMALISRAGESLLPDGGGRAMVRELARAAGPGGMVGGQVMDLEAEGRSLDVDGITAVHRRKTGALFEGSLRIGGLAGGAAPARVDALGRAGAWLGLAFQIVDDLLDETGETARIGKTAGRDRVQAKATYPMLLGIDGARARADAAANAAAAELTAAGIEDPVLGGLIRFAVSRDR
jgi:geranylgeranyl pyrophosphate synthase